MPWRSRRSAAWTLKALRHRRARRAAAWATEKALRRYAASVRRPALAAIPAVVALARKRRDLGLPRTVSVPLAATAPLLAASALPRGKPRAALTWAAFMWSYKVAFEVPYDRPERLYRRLHVDEAIAVDTWIGAGETPTQRLQEQLRRPPQLSALDRAATALYLTWEFVPHATLAWILARRPDRFHLAAARLGATYASTLLGYFLYPAAPPWWASEREGRMDRAVRRVTMEVLKDFKDEPRPGSDHNSDANPWAAMPSDHLATSAMTAMLLAGLGRRAGAAGAAYAAALGAVLVYTGEHYVVDLAAGLALACATYAAAPALAEPLRRLGDALAPG
jgi:membrane-associated phospholipid phosphatase